MNTVKESSLKIIIRLKGFLIVRKNKDTFEKEYWMYCANNQRFRIKPTPLWDTLLKKLSWEHVALGGYQDLDDDSIELLYLFKNKYLPKVNQNWELYYEDERDLDFIEHEIDQTGILSPVA